MNTKDKIDHARAKLERAAELIKSARTTRVQQQLNQAIVLHREARTLLIEASDAMIRGEDG